MANLVKVNNGSDLVFRTQLYLDSFGSRLPTYSLLHQITCSSKHLKIKWLDDPFILDFCLGYLRSFIFLAIVCEGLDPLNLDEFDFFFLVFGEFD